MVCCLKEKSILLDLVNVCRVYSVDCYTEFLVLLPIFIKNSNWFTNYYHLRRKTESQYLPLSVNLVGQKDCTGRQ